MTDEEKAKWFDIIVARSLQVCGSPETGWSVNEGHSGYQGNGDYDDDCEGATLNAAFAAFEKRISDRKAAREKSLKEFELKTRYWEK